MTTTADDGQEAGEPTGDRAPSGAPPVASSPDGSERQPPERTDSAAGDSGAGDRPAGFAAEPREPSTEPSRPGRPADESPPSRPGGTCDVQGAAPQRPGALLKPPAPAGARRPRPHRPEPRRPASDTTPTVTTDSGEDGGGAGELSASDGAGGHSATTEAGEATEANADSGEGDPFDTDRLPAPEGASRTLLGSLLRPHRRRVALAALVLLVQQAAVQAGPLLVAFAIDSGVPALRTDDGSSRDWGPLLGVAIGYLVCSVVSGWLQHTFIMVTARVNQPVLLELRGRIYRHAQALSVDFHDRYTSGRLISRATTDVESLRELLEEGLQELLTVLLSVVYILVMLLCLDWGLGGAALLSFVPLYLLVRGFQRRSMRAYRRKSTAIARVIVRFAETMNGIRPVQSFRRERANEAVFDELNRRHLRVNGDAILEMARYVVTSRLVANTAVAGIVVWGAHRVASGGLALGVLAASVLYLRRLYDPIDRLGMFLNSYQSAAASLEKVAGLLAQRPSVPEPRVGAAVPERADGPRGRTVTFEDVSFGYRTGGEVLPRFHLTLEAGRTVAVVGATGAGKTTVAKLLARFHDPSTGRVLLDGVDLRELDTATLRREVVMVTQEPFLFSGSVAENIAIGRPDASREEVERAAKAIGAHGFIAALPDGYDTDVRKRGARISAGQRQLVSFARALLADPAVLVLDEATSSLDIPGERAVQRAMRTVLRGRTAVLIAHRLSTVSVADRVLVMADGHIVEEGTPDQLIASEGRYADLHRAWRNSLT